MTSKLAGGTSSFTEAFESLRQFSATIGSNPALVQGAGGNTSLKEDGTLWIKASGTWLQNAMQADQFVPVAIDPLLEAVANADARAEKAVDFVIAEHNPSGLRPSIETTVHALLPQRIVVHVHCVETIALAVQQEAEQLLSARLSAFNWSWIPYVRPGLPLAHMINTHKAENSDVLVLGNHGLVVAADSVGDAAELLEQVVAAVRCVPRPATHAATIELEQLAATTDYRLALHTAAHGVACDTDALQVASGGSLYPDHVIFLGESSVVARPGETIDDVLQRQRDENKPEPVSIIVPEHGVLMHARSSPGQQALAQCLSDVCLRIPARSAIHYLDEHENHALLNWEAEHYRQQLEKANH